MSGESVLRPAGAADAGFLDRVTSPESLWDEALAEAGRLAALDPTAVRNTKERLRSEAMARIRRSLAGDAEQLAGGPS